MDCWEILGIKETQDEDRIRKAYLKMLPQFHPEENPEGFKALREALEEAMKAASGSGAKQEAVLTDSREIRNLLKEVRDIYEDFGRRIKPQEWKTLAAQSVCEDLETQKEAGWALLGFLMDHIHLPHDCYKALDEIFGWTETGEELYAHFPEGFVRYLMDRIEEEDSFRYDKTPVREDFDYDAFFEGFFELRTAVGEKDRDKVEKGMEELDAMEMEHPDLSILKIRHLSMIRGMEQETWDMARELYKKDGANGPTRYWYVRSAIEANDSGADPEELEQIVTSLVEEDPDSPGYWQLCGEFLKNQNRLEQALRAFGRARDCSQEEWGYLEEQIAETAHDLSVQMEEEGCEDSWALAHICWSGRRYDKVRELLTAVQPQEGREMTWLILMAGSCHELEDYKEALRYREKIWDTYDGDQKPLELYMDLAEEYDLTGNHEKALEIYGQACEMFKGEPEIYYRQAKILEEQEKPEEAIAMCDRALEIGFYQDAFNLRLEILLDIEEYEQVKEAAEKVMEQGYRSAQVLFDYARALHELEDYAEAEKVLDELYRRTDGADVVCEEYASLCYDSDRSEEALKWIEEAIGKRDTLKRQYRKGDYLRDLDRYEEELAVYEALRQQGIQDWYTRYRMGRALEHMDHYERAEEYYRQSIEEHGDYSPLWDSLGDVLQQQGRWKEAVTAYEAGTELNHLQSTRDLCRLLKRLHEDDKAQEAIEKGLEKWPQDGSLLLLYSDILLRKKEYNRAVKCLNRYIEVKPAQTERGYREIAQCYEREENLDKAQEYYQKAIDLSPGSARCWRLMGKFLANVRKDQDKALPFLKKSVELMPDSTYGFMKLGEVYEALGQKEEAVVCYEKALENYRADIEKDPGDCCNYEGTADVLIHLGRFDEAEEMIQKAMSLEKKVFTCSCPFCYEALEDMAKIEERKGNLEKALEWMEQAGRLASTDYYPKEIARLKAAIGDQ